LLGGLPPHAQEGGQVCNLYVFRNLMLSLLRNFFLDRLRTSVIILLDNRTILVGTSKYDANGKRREKRRYCRDCA
jgi:hypothetical protein